MAPKNVQRRARMRRAPRGFSLVELLTVLSILYILAALLFPVFARVRENARRASCTSNLRQIGMAMVQYSQDYDERLPLYSQGSGYAGFLGYYGGDGPRWTDEIFPYVKTTQIFDCPSGRLHMKKYAGGQYFDIETYSYGFNTPSSPLPPDSDFGVAGRHLAELLNPSGTIMVADDSGIDESCGRVIPDSLDTLDSLSLKIDGVRHTGAWLQDYSNQAFNAVYADGHAKWTRLPDTYGTAAPYMKPWTTEGG